MPPPLTFHLNACTVSHGVSSHSAKCDERECFAQLSKRPLIGSSESSTSSSGGGGGAGGAGGGGGAPSAGLSMRFQTPSPPHPCATAVGLRLDFSNLLAQSVNNGASHGLAVVERFAPAPVADAARALHARVLEPNQAAAAAAAQRDDVCVYIDQYEVGERDPALRKKGCHRILEVVYGVLCSNPTPTHSKDTWSALLGPTGHYERFSAWSHIVGTVLFLAYGVVRLAIPDNNAQVEQILTTVAAFGTAFVFLSSSIYHSTAPDPSLAYFTRFLDFFAIYLGIVLTATADIAVATHGFRDVPVVTIVDLPIAGAIVIVFFLWRRHRVLQEDTWVERKVGADASGCILSDWGLFSRGHHDLQHSQLRQTTSLLLCSSYFMSVPAAFMTLDSDVIAVVLSLQGVAFISIVFGMTLDNLLKWPNKQLAEGKHQWMACPGPGGPGCVVTSHGVWHIIALVGTVLTFVAREFALVNYA